MELFCYKIIEKQYGDGVAVFTPKWKFKFSPIWFSFIRFNGSDRETIKFKTFAQAKTLIDNEIARLRQYADSRKVVKKTTHKI